MTAKSSRVFFGALLIFLGLLFFFQQFLHVDVGALVFAGLFVLGGAIFFYVFVNNNEHWWALIPGFTLVGIGGLIAMAELAPGLSEFGGGFFLGMIGASFLVIYLLHREFWWAIIPAGVLLTLAVVALIAPFSGAISGAVFFFGLAITFGVLGLMPVGKTEKWPWIPAGICAAIGLIILATSNALTNTIFAYIWPAALLVIGVYMVVRSARRK